MNTCEVTDRVVKDSRRLFIQAAPTVYRPAAQCSIIRMKKTQHKPFVINQTESTRKIISHAEVEAEVLLKKERTLSVTCECIFDCQTDNSLFYD